MASGNALSAALARPSNALVALKPTLTPTARRPLIASASPMAINTVSALDIRQTRQVAQHLAWQYFRGIGAVWYGNIFKANAISGVSIYPAEIVRPGEDPVPVDDVNSLQQVTLDDLSAGYSGLALGHAPMMAALTLHDSIAGECFWYSHAGPDGDNVHEILSTEELEPGPSGFQIRRQPGIPPEQIAPDSLLTRMWTPDPLFKHFATSPMLCQNDTLEEMWLLIQAGVAAAKSRLFQSKIMTLPKELDLDSTEGPDDEPTKFVDELLQAGRTAIKNPNSPARWFPLIIRGKSDYLKPEFLRTVDLFKDMPVEIRAQILELRTRFAHDFDLPTELLTGLGDMTHWNAWIIDSMTWPHLRPIVERILANLAISAYQPFLIAGGMDPREARRQVIWYDESQVVAKPDRSGASVTLGQLGLLNPEAMLRSNGFDPVLDAPTEIQRARQFGEKWGDPGLASAGGDPEIWGKATGRIATRVTETEKGIEGEGPVAEEDVPSGPHPVSPTPGPPNPAPPSGPPAPSAAPPTPAVAASGNGHRAGTFATRPHGNGKLDRKRAKLKALGSKLGAIDRNLLLRISVLADERLHAVVKTAGNKLRSAAQGRPLLASSIRGVDALFVPRMLGPANVHQLGLDETLLIDQAARNFANKTAPWMADAQQATLSRIADATDQDPEDLAPDGASDWITTATGILVAGFMAEAGRFLFNPEATAGPGEVSDIVAPRGAIRDALAVAGGADASQSPPPGLAWGPMAQDALGSGGAAVDSYVWSYNDMARTTFPGHLALDQIEFTGWDDDQLAVQPEDSWLDVAYYAPNDHDGCFVAGTVVSGPSARASTDRWYRGNLIDLVTADGYQLSGTPNHPVLTSEGWIALGALKEGDDVVCGNGSQGIASLVDPDDYQTPALIEEVVKFSGVAGVGLRYMPTSPVDFHGDGKGSKIHVVRSYGLLKGEGQTAFPQPALKGLSRGRDPNLVSLSASSIATALLPRDRLASNSIVGSGSHPLTVFGGPRRHERLIDLGLSPTFHAGVSQTGMNHGPTGSVTLREFQFSDPGAVSLSNLSNREPTGTTSPVLGSSQLTTVPQKPSSFQLTLEGKFCHATHLGRLVQGHASGVQLSRIVKLSRRSFSGHVYNLDTGVGWYIANGIIAHNCSCTVEPVLGVSGEGADLSGDLVGTEA